MRPVGVGTFGPPTWRDRVVDELPDQGVDIITSRQARKREAPEGQAGEDTGTVELLGDPLSHPFLPLLISR